MYKCIQITSAQKGPRKEKLWRARAGMLSCRIEPVHTGKGYQQPLCQRQGIRGSTITCQGEWLGKMRFGFCFIFRAQAKVAKINKACGRTKAVETKYYLQSCLYLESKHLLTLFLNPVKNGLEDCLPCCSVFIFYLVWSNKVTDSACH